MFSFYSLLEGLGGINIEKEKSKSGTKLILLASEISKRIESNCLKNTRDNTVCRCKGISGYITFLKRSIPKCNNDKKCIERIKNSILNNEKSFRENCSEK